MRIIKSLCYFVFAAVLVSCSSKKIEPGTLAKENHRMFWSISGTDKNGQPAKIYIQGTYHVGDERALKLDDEVFALFDGADRVAGEIANADMEENAGKVAIKYGMLGMVKTMGKKIQDQLTDEEINKIKSFKMIKEAGEGNPELEQGILEMSNFVEPYALTTALSILAIKEYAGFSEQYSIDEFLNKRCAEKNIPNEGLDTLEDQFEALSYGSYDFQISCLKDFLAQIPDGISKVADGYNSWINDDVDAVAKANDEEREADLKKHKEYEAFYKKIIDDRNEKWADKFRDYLYEGGTTFIFAGTGHFAGKGNVFDLMKAKGYLK